MLRFVDTQVTFSEVPDEISLSVNISGCPLRCQGCHSPHLWKDDGEVLDDAALDRLLLDAKGVTCLCLLGGDGDTVTLRQLLKDFRKRHPNIKTCWYSGRELKDAQSLLPYLDYIKTGPFIEEYGPLKSPTTNQRFYKIKNDGTNHSCKDITSSFYTIIEL